jgi:hypothetical protein
MIIDKTGKHGPGEYLELNTIFCYPNDDGRGVSFDTAVAFSKELKKFYSEVHISNDGKKIFYGGYFISGRSSYNSSASS